MLRTSTGTALWSCGIACVNPDVAVEALETLLDQASPVEYLPKNMSIYYWNVFTESLAYMHEAYVRVRLISIAIKAGNSKPLIDNLWKLLSKRHQSAQNFFSLLGADDIPLPWSLAAGSDGTKRRGSG